MWGHPLSGVYFRHWHMLVRGENIPTIYNAMIHKAIEAGIVHALAAKAVDGLVGGGVGA